MNISGWVQLQFDCKCFKFSCLKVCWKFQSMLKSVMHVESILTKSVENYKKACWNLQHVLKTVKKHVENFSMFWKLSKSMLKISACSENCNACCVFKISGCVENMLKISRHVENYNMCRKLCWNSMLKISACVEHCNACWKLYVKISRCVENVYVRHVENHIENHVEVQKKDHHTLWHVLKFVFLVRFYTRKQSETYLKSITF